MSARSVRLLKPRPPKVVLVPPLSISAGARTIVSSEKDDELKGRMSGWVGATMLSVGE